MNKLFSICLSGNYKNEVNVFAKYASTHQYTENSRSEDVVKTPEMFNYVSITYQVYWEETF
jgi:hypothetical protein